MSARRLVGVVAALLTVSLVAGCSSSTDGSGALLSGSASSPASTDGSVSSSASPSTPVATTSSSSTATTSGGAPGVVQPVTVSEFLTPTEAGHPVKSSKVSDPTKPSQSTSPFGCLDVTPLLATDPTLKAAPFGIQARDQTYSSGQANDASFLFEAVLNTPAPQNAALIARVLGAALARCTKPALKLFGARFTATRSVVSPPSGCDSGKTSLTVALGRPAGTDPNKPVGVEIDTYVVQQGTRFAVALNFYPLIQGSPLAASQLASKICAHLR